jgi:hypothetical protein
VILLSQPPKCWDYRNVPPCPALEFAFDIKNSLAVMCGGSQFVSPALRLRKEDCELEASLGYITISYL